MKISAMTGVDRRAFNAASADGKRELCVRLAAELTRRLTGAVRFHDVVVAAVSDLRQAGHDLWSYDEDEEFEVWGPNYALPSGPGIVITFRSGGPTEVNWSIQGAS
jgi:hypothetical protein